LTVRIEAGQFAEQAEVPSPTLKLGQREPAMFRPGKRDREGTVSTTIAFEF
jgi:hypothetical protein